MAKEIKTANTNNASENDAINVKEVTDMKNQETEVKEVQQEVPAETAAQVPAEVEPEKESLGKRIWKGVKKGAKYAAVAAAIVGGVFIGEKIGEAVGFDKATDNYNKLSGSGSDDPEDIIVDSDVSDSSDDGFDVNA